jgi:hypothetical protein
MDNGEKVDAAINAHTNWLVRLRVAIENGTSEFKPEIVKTDDNCEFGKWLYGDFPESFMGKPIYQVIKELHADFHRQAAIILELALAGEKEKAIELMKLDGEFRKHSLSLIMKLNQLKKDL